MSRSPSKKSDHRWPVRCLGPNEYILLPKVLVKRLGALQIQPHHMWLILLLQVDRYEDRDPRWYWEELARFVGRDKNTVRRWAYELRDMGLLQIKQNRTKDPRHADKVNFRNERNTFILTPFDRRIEAEQKSWDKERENRRSPARQEAEE